MNAAEETMWEHRQAAGRQQVDGEGWEDIGKAWMVGHRPKHIWGYGGQNQRESAVRKQGNAITSCQSWFPCTPLTRTACFRVRVLAPTEVPNCEASTAEIRSVKGREAKP